MKSRVSRRRFLEVAGGAALGSLVLRASSGAMAQGSGRTAVNWLGHAAFRVTTPTGKVILIDPWLTNPKAPGDAKGIDKADLILLSHGHGDHVGQTVDVAKASGARIVTIPELGRRLVGVGAAAAQVTGMNMGGSFRPIQGTAIKVTMIRADHSFGFSFTDPQTKVPTDLMGGAACGFVVELENGFKFVHAGDTGLYGDMKLFGERYRPNLAMLPIGDHFTMGPEDAAVSAFMWGVKDVIPMHYGTFPVLTGTVEAFQKALDAGQRLHAMKPGDTITL
jgi:L-ascorbate metabolism protein UlaG (beta-lactamase superfamily)